jgi:FtsH-binding integral membrane protein
MLSAFTAFGVALSAIGAYVAQSQHIQLNLWLFLGVLVCGLIGVGIASLSDNPLVSFIGYIMVAGPFGLLMGPLVAHYTAASILRVFILTTGMVFVLGIVGAVIPDSLESWGIWLFGGLGILLLGYFIVPVAGLFGLPVDHAMTWLDWLGVILFSGYVIYDLNRAMRLPRTVDNAVDSALAVYLDFVNLFIRLLELIGQESSD